MVATHEEQSSNGHALHSREVFQDRSNGTSELGPAEKSVKPDIPPEEGRQGWIVVAGAFLAMVSTFGFLNAIGVFQTYYQQNSLSKYSSSDISWIFSFQLSMMWISGPIIGRVVDTYGPAPVLWPGSVLCVFGLCMTSLSTEYYQIFLAQGVAFGLGAGCIFTSSVVCVGQWFVKRRGLGVGVAAAGSSLGGVIFPLFLDRVVADVGFYGAIRYTALLVGILLAIACMLIKSRLPRKKWNTKDKWFDLSLFTEPKFALFTFGSFFVMWALWFPLNYSSTFALSQGYPYLLSLALISIINATSIAGRILPPYLADTFGHLNTMASAGFLMGASMLCLWLPFDFHPSLAGVIIFCLVYGFVSGSFVSLVLPAVAKFGSIETMGMRFGNFQMVLAVSSLTGLPITGGILARQHGDVFWGAQVFAIVSAMLGASMITGAIVLLRRERGSWKI